MTWSKTSSQGLGIKQWKAARPTELRYNPKKVAYFSRLYCLRWIFRPWRAKQKIWSEVTKRRRDALHRFVLSVFRSFKMYTKHLRRLRVLTIQTWRGYVLTILTYIVTPFINLSASPSHLLTHPLSRPTRQSILSLLVMRRRLCWRRSWLGQVM